MKVLLFYSFGGLFGFSWSATQLSTDQIRIRNRKIKISLQYDTWVDLKSNGSLVQAGTACTALEPLLLVPPVLLLPSPFTGTVSRDFGIIMWQRYTVLSPGSLLHIACPFNVSDELLKLSLSFSPWIKLFIPVFFSILHDSAAFDNFDQCTSRRPMGRLTELMKKAMKWDS
jgi:hypothetical protein